MFGSEVLEVAIGTVFVYLFLSLICSALNEWVARMLGMRSKTLEAGIRNLLSDPMGEGFAQKLYAHPLVKGLARNKPSYIPSRTFALALFDIIAPAEGTQAKTISEIRAAITQIEEPKIQRSLLSLMDAAKDDLEKARKNVEAWFDDAMDRVSGWYKRKAQLITFVSAFAVSVVLNADTVMLVGILSVNPTVRAVIVASATEIAHQEALPDASAMIGKARAELQHLQLLGWSKGRDDPRQVPITFGGWVMKLAGLLLTTIAATFGAPFWFDVLNKLVNLRGAGKPPEKTPEAVSQSGQ